jgi:hypothetical protein
MQKEKSQKILFLHGKIGGEILIGYTFRVGYTYRTDCSYFFTGLKYLEYIARIRITNINQTICQKSALIGI